MIETSDGPVVAAAWLLEECQRALEAERVKTGKREELLKIIKHLKTQLNGLMTTMERKDRMMKGTSEEIQKKFPKQVLDVEKKLSDVDSELFEASEQRRRLKARKAMPKAVVRREPADTQEDEACQLNDTDVDMDENKEELSVIPSAVSSPVD